MKRKAKRALKIKLIIINLLIGSGLTHLKKHDPHIHARCNSKNKSQEMSLVIHN